MRNSDRS